MPTPLDAADALEALLPAIAEICEIMRDVPAEVRERARPWLSCLDRATGTEAHVTIEDTIAELRATGGAHTGKASAVENPRENEG